MFHYLQVLGSVVEYALLMRVPLLTGAIVVLLPWLVRQSSFKALLLGLFDVTPAGTAAVTVAAMAAATSVVDNARIIYMHSAERGVGGLASPPTHFAWYWWFVLTAALSLPVILYTIRFSDQQNHGDLRRRIGFALMAGLPMLAAQFGIATLLRSSAKRIVWSSTLPGYTSMEDHILAAGGFGLTLGVYVFLGWYGYERLGKERTVPALCSALMVLVLGCSVLSALSFYLDLWHVPLLLILTIWGVITTQTKASDHYYDLLKVRHGARPAPTPVETVRATKNDCRGRIVVVAANGGGIQAAAWAAQVLEGLSEEIPGFKESVRLISSVSGGSLGSVCYAHSLANPTAEGAFVAASRSSLDEVAWGLSWPDLISSIFPWITKNFVGRGRALERAWIANGKTSDEDSFSLLDKPLSEWNAAVRSGDMPALIMNATLVESGNRLLLGTTRFTKNESSRARLDATKLHGETRDVAAVTAARLSASFPYVTPAARFEDKKPQPHVVDGGYYDNYGMSTLVEWLDEALCADQESDTSPAVKSVLVLQVHGAPVSRDGDPQSGDLTDRGWFFQIGAPIVTLANVRGAGQIAHNDIELLQLQQRWFGTVPIHSVTLEFPDEDAPLSWHLTQSQRENVLDRWDRCEAVLQARVQIAAFLGGSERIDCSCPTCRGVRTLESTSAKA